MENLLIILTKPDNIPITLMLFLMPFFTWLAFREAFATDRRLDEGKKPAEAVLGPEIDLPEKVHVWPFLLRIEFLSAIGCMIFLIVWSTYLDAPLEEPANSAITPNPSKAPWYFLGLQELLVYFDPWIAGVVLPTVIVVGLMAIPYLDVNTRGNGYYTWKDRKFAIATFCFGFLLLWCSMIVIGTLLRGPGWMWFWPWEKWDPHKVVSEVNVDFSDFFGVPSASMLGMAMGAGFIGAWFLFWLVVPWFVMKAKKAPIIEELGLARYAVTNVLFSSMMFVVFKMVLRLGISLKYVLVTPWFNI